MYNMATWPSRRAGVLAESVRRRPCKVGLGRHGDMLGYHGRLRLDRRVEAYGMEKEGGQSSCWMAAVGADSQTSPVRR